MAFVPFTNAVEVIIRFTLFGVPVAIVIGGINGGGVSPANQLTLATAIDTWRKTYLQPIMTSTCIATDVKVYDLTSASSPVITFAATAPTAGADASFTPAQTAEAVTFVTAKRGRSYRGRNYMFALAPTRVLNAGNWTAATLVAVVAAYAALPAAMGGAGYGHVVLSRRTLNADRALGVATIVTGYTTTSKIETQRRRLG